MTRVQRERFIDLEEYERVKNVYVLTASMLEGCREHLRTLHPLPRVGEIAQDVDDTPYAYYVEQAQGGLYVRQSILCEVLGLEVND
jgi:aspartate carbamoyltransferase